MIAIFAIAYYAGGYVAGRMSRFDGGRQGLGVWIVGLLVTILAVVLGLIFGEQYNVLDRVNPPDINTPEDAGIGAIIAGVVLLVVVGPHRDGRRQGGPPLPHQGRRGAVSGLTRYRTLSRPNSDQA